MISTIQSSTPLSDAYFSTLNEDSIQEQIRYEVFLKTNKTIGRQDSTQLQLIMRSIFLQHCKNIPTDILKQIRDLNKIVIDYCVEQIVVQVIQRDNYLRDLEMGPQPMERSINVSNSGEKVLVNKIGFSDEPIGKFL